MSEVNVIKRTGTPATVRSLLDDFSKLGVTPGMTILLHSSLSALGWVCGGSFVTLDSNHDLQKMRSLVRYELHFG